MSESRRRSASPRRDGDRDARRRDDSRERPRKSKGSSGFKFKDKGKSESSRKRDEPSGARSANATPSKALEETRNERLDREAREAFNAAEDAEKDGAGAEPTIDDEIAAKFSAAAVKKSANKTKTGISQSAAEATKTAAAAAPKPRRDKPALPPSNEPMILVTINDRLGTKAQIPCLASDPVKMFKVLVANRIGRKPHEIMLKRQGERPFKDQLTLADYGVSNGVQLDLELDTGD